MNYKFTKLVQLATVLVTLILSAATPVEAQVRIVVSPPSWYIGTRTPVYYEGRATYWYGNRWYYRDGHSWRYYNDEPSHLRDHRGHRHSRRHYGRGHWRGSRR
jgi:hypothetical protein